MEATIRVNHPLTYRGYSIYQSDFGDGGSKLDLRAWPLTVARLEPTEAKGTVGGSLKVGGSNGALTLELDDFRLFNLLRNPTPDLVSASSATLVPALASNCATRPARLGSTSITWRRCNWKAAGFHQRHAGPARRAIHLSAYSGRPEQQSRTLPALQRLLARFRLAARYSGPCRAGGGREPGIPPRPRTSATEPGRTVRSGRNRRGGGAGQRWCQPNGCGRRVRCISISCAIPWPKIFIEVLREGGSTSSMASASARETFFNDAVSALSALPSYASPFYLQLSGFQRVEASGLQFTHSGGVSVVYTGFALLVIGVFIMFYTSHRRVWAWLAIEEGMTRLILAGTGNRRQTEFAREFAGLRTMFERRLGPSEEERLLRPLSRPGRAGSGCRASSDSDERSGMAMAVTREALLEQWSSRPLALFDDRGRSVDAAGGGRLDPGLVVLSLVHGWLRDRHPAGGTLGLIAWGCTGNRCGCSPWRWRCWRRWRCGATARITRCATAISGSNTLENRSRSCG